MSKIKLSIITALLILSSVSYGQSLELSVGNTNFRQRGDGIWHQKHYGPYTLNTQSTSFSIGITDEYNGMKWRVGVQYLGKYSTKCECLSSDRAYELYKEGNDIGWPKSYYKTNGSSYGVYATILPEYKLNNGSSLFVELGVGYNSVSNKVQVIDWYPATNSEHTEWGNAQFLAVDNKRRWKFTPIIGAGITKDNATLAINVRQINTNGPWYPIANKYTVSLEFRYVFR